MTNLSAQPTAADRLAVHEAMETLVKSEDHDARMAAAQIIIAYGDRLPKPPKRQFRLRLPWSSGGGHTTGHAAGVGDVSLDTGAEKKPVEWSSTSHEADRVGHYRLDKVSDWCLEFYHFWGSSDATSGSSDPLERPPTYAIVYDPASLTMEAFGVYEGRIAWELNLWLFVFRLYVWAFQSLLGKTSKRLSKKFLAWA